MRNYVTAKIPVRVRKYSVDTNALCELLRAHKHVSCVKLADMLDVPQTMVEHWFRKDQYFAIPDAEIWYELKKALNIESDTFDEQITSFIDRQGAFEMSERFYLPNRLAPTIMSGQPQKVIVNERINKT